jgi:plastocyanin
MEQTPFYIAGGILVAIALVVSFVGLRFEDFPRSRGLLMGGLALFGLLVVATAAAAVINARDEQQHRRAELAEEEHLAGAESAEAEETGAEGPDIASPDEQQAAQEQQQGEEAQGTETLELSSPEDGGLSFEPAELEAASGEVTLDYTNPSAVTHNVALEDSNGELLGEGELVTDGDVSTVSTELEPGDYTYFCAVAGHREGGMEGPLTVE